MPDLKTIRRRIASVRSTQKITRAMEMVAAAKLRRAQDDLLAIRPYTRRIGELLTQVAGSAGAELHPLLAARPERRQSLVLVITSDRGLCGGFNANAMNMARRAYGQEQGQGATVQLVTAGRKAKDLLKREPLPVARVFELHEPPVPEQFQELASYFIEAFLSGQTDACQLVFNRFVSTSVQQPVIEPLLPVRAAPEVAIAAPGAPGADGSGDGRNFRYEPDPAQLLAELLPMYVESRLQWALLESRAAEQAARMVAMQGANRNAEQMIANLTLEYNKARQTAITTELMEIVAGAEALH